MTPNLSLTVSNLTPSQLKSIHTILFGCEAQAAAVPATATKEEAPAKKTKKKPEATVSDEEDEDFGKKAMDSEDLEDAEDEEESDESEDEDEDEEEAGVTWDEVKAAINKYGDKKPLDMQAILKSQGVKNTKDLMGAKKKWEVVYRKTMAAIKAAKKAA